MRMEFSTMEELMEEGARYLFDTEFGVMGEIMEEKTFETMLTHSKSIAKEKYIHRVYAMLPTGKLYVGEKGTTFYARDAKLFTLNVARTKADAMTKHGKYKWMVE